MGPNAQPPEGIERPAGRHVDHRETRPHRGGKEKDHGREQAPMRPSKQALLAVAILSCSTVIYITMNNVLLLCCMHLERISICPDIACNHLYFRILKYDEFAGHALEFR